MSQKLRGQHQMKESEEDAISLFKKLTLELYSFINNLDSNKIGNEKYLKRIRKELEEISKNLIKCLIIYLREEYNFHFPEEIITPRLEISTGIFDFRPYYDYSQKTICLSHYLLKKETPKDLFLLTLLEENIHYIQQRLSPDIFEILREEEESRSNFHKELKNSIEIFAYILLYDFLRYVKYEKMWRKIKILKREYEKPSKSEMYLLKVIPYISKKDIKELIDIFTSIRKVKDERSIYSRIYYFFSKLHESLSFSNFFNQPIIENFVEKNLR